MSVPVESVGPHGPTAPPGAWATHRADVRTRSVEAYLALLETAGPSGVSMPAVAERAGISVRTLYRYYTAKDDLQRDAAGWLERPTRLAMAGQALDRSNVQDYLRRLWKDLAAELPAVRVQHTTPAGRQLRATRLDQNRANVDRGLPARITGARRDEVIDLAVALTSSSMFLELVDRMGHDPVQAADLVADVLEVMIATEAGRASGEEKEG